MRDIILLQSIARVSQKVVGTNRILRSYYLVEKKSLNAFCKNFFDETIRIST